MADPSELEQQVARGGAACFRGRRGLVARFGPLIWQPLEAEAKEP